ENNVGNGYFEENASPVAHDHATVTDLSSTAVTPAGTFQNCLHTTNTDLEMTTENKFYSAGIGFVFGVAPDGTDQLLSFTSGSTHNLVQAMASFGSQSAAPTVQSSQHQAHVHLADMVAQHHSHDG